VYARLNGVLPFLEGLYVKMTAFIYSSESRVIIENLLSGLFTSEGSASVQVIPKSEEKLYHIAPVLVLNT